MQNKTLKVTLAAFFALAFIVTTVTTSFAYQAFTFINRSSTSVCYIHVSPSSSDSWGNDHAPADQCIEPGYEYHVAMNGYGNTDMFDIRLQGASENTLATRNNVDLSVVYEVIYTGGSSISVN